MKRIYLMVMLGTLFLALTTGVALAQTFNEIQCDEDESRCEGTDEDDQITGTEFSDNIFAFEGDDEVDAEARSDEVRGGRGADVLFGDSPQRDSDTRRDGDDEVRGGKGRDLVVGLGGSDDLFGGRGSDGIDARELSQNPGEDNVQAGDDDDTIVAEDGFEDTIDCGEGFDTVFFDEDLDTLIDCEDENPTTAAATAAPESPAGLEERGQ